MDSTFQQEYQDDVAEQKKDLLKAYFLTVEVFNDYCRAIQFLTGDQPSVDSMLDTLRQLANNQADAAIELARLGFNDTHEIWRAHYLGGKENG